MKIIARICGHSSTRITEKVYAPVIDDTVVNAMAKYAEKLKPTEMVGVKEAARILGISEGRMREIKDKFPHIKSGYYQQGRLLFVRSSLLENWMDYARETGSPIVCLKRNL